MSTTEPPGDSPDYDRTVDRPRYREAERALREINELLAKALPTSADYVVEMIHSIIGKAGRRIVLYLGAGCSSAVDVDQTVGSSQYKGGDWLDLLTGLLEQIPPNQRNDLLRSLGYFELATAGFGTREAVRELVSRFDKLRVAWFLGSHDGKDRERRDKDISTIVEPPAGATRRSRLYQELLKLPFDDIVTTNYDSNILWFLEKFGIDCCEITKSADLASSLQNESRRRLIYLHGKANNSPSPLTLDRFDYAELLAERDGLLDFTTYLLREAHVIYVGFGLDDPSFNLIETRLQKLLGAYRPKSFAFMDHVTERERNMWRARNLSIIAYGAEHRIVPRILKRVNVIRRFFDIAEPDPGVLRNHRDDRTGGYRGEGLRLYVKGRFSESAKMFRAALASTLFWERRRGPDGVERSILPFDRAAIVCELRIRLAMNHYKLRWVPDDIDDHLTLLNENLDSAYSLIGDMEGMKAFIQPNERVQANRVLTGLLNSVKVLESRELYHNGKFTQARKLLGDVLDAAEAPILSARQEEDHATVISKLKLAEAHYYAKCHKSRIDYQYLTHSQNGSKGGIAESQMLEELAVSIKQTRLYVEEYRKSCGTTAEWEYYLNTFGTLHRIAQWTAGRHALRVCDDIIPVKSERTGEVLHRIDDGLKLLDTDPVETGENIWGISGRWSATRHRYQCRGYALRWLLLKQLEPDQTHEGDLTIAYDALQRALNHKGRGLERQVVLNLLEAARLNLIVMFGERISQPTGKCNANSPLTLAACVYYLDKAFDAMASIPNGANERWVQILGFRLASYFAVLSSGLGAPRAANGKLNDFLERSFDEMIDVVTQSYKQFDVDLPGNEDRYETVPFRTFAQRTSFYTTCIRALREELSV